MATYVVTNHSQDNYESGRRFKTRGEAERIFEQEVEKGKLVRLIRWDWVSPGKGRPTEIKHHNRA